MSLYQTLGIREGANPIEIQAAYTALNEAHRDSSDIELQLEINMAYQTLIHPSRRADYDGSRSIPVYAEKPPVMDRVQEKYFQPEIRVVNTYPQNPVSYQENTLQTVVVYFFVGLVGSMFLLAISLAA